MKVAALIPARSGSVRVKDKNIRLFGNYPLLGRKIRQLQTSRVDGIFLGSNDSSYLEIAEKFGATPVYRSERACDESQSTANDMIADFTARIPDEFDVVVWAHCTNPFLYGRQYDSALEMFQQSSQTHDSVMSVQKIQNHMWKNDQSPLNYNPWSPSHTLAADLEPVYFQTGGIFIQSSANIRKNHYFFGEKPKFVLHDQLESIDIDTEHDFVMAHSLAQFIDEREGFN